MVHEDKHDRVTKTSQSKLHKASKPPKPPEAKHSQASSASNVRVSEQRKTKSTSKVLQQHKTSATQSELQFHTAPKPTPDHDTAEETRSTKKLTHSKGSKQTTAHDVKPQSEPSATRNHRPTTNSDAKATHPLPIIPMKNHPQSTLTTTASKTGTDVQNPSSTETDSSNSPTTTSSELNSVKTTVIVLSVILFLALALLVCWLLWFYFGSSKRQENRRRCCRWLPSYSSRKQPVNPAEEQFQPVTTMNEHPRSKYVPKFSDSRNDIIMQPANGTSPIGGPSYSTMKPGPLPQTANSVSILRGLGDYTANRSPGPFSGR